MWINIVVVNIIRTTEAFSHIVATFFLYKHSDEHIESVQSAHVAPARHSKARFIN